MFKCSTCFSQEFKQRVILSGYECMSFLQKHLLGDMAFYFLDPQLNEQRDFDL